MSQQGGFWKAVLSAIIWLVVAGLGLAVILESGGSYNTDTHWMMIIPLLAAVLSMFFIWVGPELAHNDRLEAQEKREWVREKDKHYSTEGTRLALLMEMMDDDERAAFKESLKRKMLGESRLTADGELSGGLDQLFEEDEVRNSYSGR